MSDRARLVGVNHVALEVGDLEAALAFYGRALRADPPRPCAGHGLRGYGLEKSGAALAELRDKGLR